MAIKRYFATADTTITNAFKDSRFTKFARATGSNMGKADSLEIFSIYGQAYTSDDGYSQELSRILLKFPVTTSDDTANSIQAHRNAGTIPNKNKVKFYLRLYNVEHDKPVPQSAKYNIFAVSSSWEEGRGLDMDEYKDITRDNVGANWINANGNIGTAKLVDAIDVKGVAQNDKFTMTVPTSAGGDGVTYTFLFDSDTDVDADEDANTFGISLTSVTDEADCAAVLVKAINGETDNKYKYGAANLGAGSYLAAGTIGLTAALSATTTTKITLTMDDKGVAGNVDGVLAAVTGFEEGSLLLTTTFTGGDGPWATVGGDYHKGATTEALSIIYDTTLDIGTEDIEVDVTDIVESWISNLHPDGVSTFANYGFGVMLTSSQEAYYSASSGANYNAISGGIIHNVTGASSVASATTSYYTKKFSSRSSEFFFKRPVLEARWDSSKKDDRGNFYYSSSLATEKENVNTVYLYNYFRGQLRNIPLVEEGDKIYVSVFSGSANNASPDTGDPLRLVPDGVYSDVPIPSNGNKIISVATGGWVETGVYTASFCITGAQPPGSEYTRLFDVWFATNSSGQSHRDGVQLHTGTIDPIVHNSAWSTAPSIRRVNSITNLRDTYYNSETARFRIYTRKKNWNPTIYTRAVAQQKSDIIESGSYRVYRIVDDLPVISYGTASATLHTQVSFDESGSYFDLDMNMLEPGYAYAIKLAYYNGSIGTWVEQPETFKFRVEKWA